MRAYIAATSIMIKDLQVQANASFIRTSWSAPRFLPHACTQTIQCSFLCELRNVPYKQQALTMTSTYLSFVTRDIRAGSRCTVTLKAIYNPAGRGPGVIKTLATWVESKSSHIFCNYTCTIDIHVYCRNGNFRWCKFSSFKLNLPSLSFSSLGYTDEKL